MIHTIKRKDKKIFQTESQYRLAGMAMTKLIHSDNLNAADEIFTHTVKIFYFETALSDLIDSVNFILEIGDFNEMPIKTEENTQFSLSNEDHDTDHAAIKKSPFFKFFNDIYYSIKAKNKETSTESNQYYCPKFIHYLLYYYIYYPIIIFFGDSFDRISLET